MHRSVTWMTRRGGMAADDIRGMTRGCEKSLRVPRRWLCPRAPRTARVILTKLPDRGSGATVWVEMSELIMQDAADAATMKRLPSARRPAGADLGAPAAALGSAGLPGEVVVAPLLDLDPLLGRDLSPALREQVRQWLVVRVCALPRGPWAGTVEDEAGTMGLLLLDGVLARN
ncbi:MAG: hypothetical protein QOJ21_2051, partial [Solirubrobacteraceae bacterium]|nr:hypothetical protein [Solirubrobacteraceae bacterium]